MKRSLVWVRRANVTKATVGTSADTAAVTSLRNDSVVQTQGGVSYPGLPNEFTVVRFLAWLSGEEQDSGAGILTNPLMPVFGVRVAGREELEELIADAGFRAESGPAQDYQADWMVWAPVPLDNYNESTGSVDVHRGKLVLDIRASRRVDSLSEDIGIFLQTESSALTTTTRSLRISYAALCMTG